MLLQVAPFWLICLGVIGFLILTMHLLVRLGGARRRRVHLAQFHCDEQGSVQSLSFVLTLPAFIIIMMGIVQVSQIMLAQVVVEYAAIAAARAASVWVPEHVTKDSDTYHRNCIGAGKLVSSAQRLEWDGNPQHALEPLEDGKTYKVPDDLTSAASKTPKIDRITTAATLACLPIAPSRGTGYQLTPEGEQIHHAMYRAYTALAGDTSAAPSEIILQRLNNKLAYSMSNTKIEIEIAHPNEPPLRNSGENDPPWLYNADYQASMAYQIWPGRLFSLDTLSLADYGYPAGVEIAVHGGVCKPCPLFGYLWVDKNYLDDSVSYKPNQIGWQDAITVTVHHDLALLPGPGRLLSRLVHGASDEKDEIAEHIERQGKEWTWPLVARATVTNEGWMPILRYEQQFGPAPAPPQGSLPPPLVITIDAPLPPADTTTPEITGTGAPYATVEVFADTEGDGTYETSLGTTEVNNDGSWSLVSAVELPTGLVLLMARQIDQDGEESPEATGEVTINPPSS
jgi:hypothetical protein